MAFGGLRYLAPAQNWGGLAAATPGLSAFPPVAAKGTAARHVQQHFTLRRWHRCIHHDCVSSCRYSVGPRPKDFDGQRALDFVLDNDTLQDFNRTLLIDIKLLSALH